MSEGIEITNSADNSEWETRMVMRSIGANNVQSVAWSNPTYVEPDETHEGAHDHYDGWIDSVKVNGKKYAIKAAVVEYHALTCPKCGGQISMHNGWGKCEYCNTEFSATIRLKEV